MGLDVGGIDHGESACRQPPIELPMKRRERRAGRPLIGLVTGDRRPKRIGRQDVIGCEMAFGKRRFAGAGRADEDDQAWILDDDDGHRAMMPQIRGGACPGSRDLRGGAPDLATGAPVEMYPQTVHIVPDFGDNFRAFRPKFVDKPVVAMGPPPVHFVLPEGAG